LNGWNSFVGNSRGAEEYYCIKLAAGSGTAGFAIPYGGLLSLR